MTEFAFSPALVRLPVGRAVRLVFINRGQLAHQFETEYLKALPSRVDSGALLLEVPGLELLRVQPGGSARLTFTPRRAARIAFTCTIEGHREAGMTGVLVIR